MQKQVNNTVDYNEEDHARSVFESLTRSVNRRRVMPPDEEVRCIKAIRDGGELSEDARAHLCVTQMREVIAIINQYTYDINELWDLLNVGNRAVEKAIDTFDTDGDISFTHYAEKLIHHAVQEYQDNINADDSSTD